MKKIHFFSKRSYSKLVLESDFQQHHLLGFQKHRNPSVLHCAVQLYHWGCAKLWRFKKKATTCPPNSSRTCVALSSEVFERLISFSLGSAQDQKWRCWNNWRTAWSNGASKPCLRGELETSWPFALAAEQGSSPRGGRSGPLSCHLGLFHL